MDLDFEETAEFVYIFLYKYTSLGLHLVRHLIQSDWYLQPLFLHFSINFLTGCTPSI